MNWPADAPATHQAFRRNATAVALVGHRKNLVVDAEQVTGWDHDPIGIRVIARRIGARSGDG